MAATFIEAVQAVHGQCPCVAVVLNKSMQHRDAGSAAVLLIFNGAAERSNVWSIVLFRKETAQLNSGIKAGLNNTQQLQHEPLAEADICVPFARGLNLRLKRAV